VVQDGLKWYTKVQDGPRFQCVLFFSLCSNLSYGQVDRLFQMGHGAISPSLMVLFKYLVGEDMEILG